MKGRQPSAVSSSIERDQARSGLTIFLRLTWCGPQELHVEQRTSTWQLMNTHGHVLQCTFAMEPLLQHLTDLCGDKFKDTANDIAVYAQTAWFVQGHTPSTHVLEQCPPPLLSRALGSKDGVLTANSHRCIEACRRMQWIHRCPDIHTLRVGGKVSPSICYVHGAWSVKHLMLEAGALTFHPKIENLEGLDTVLVQDTDTTPHSDHVPALLDQLTRYAALALPAQLQ